MKKLPKEYTNPDISPQSKIMTKEKSKSFIIKKGLIGMSEQKTFAIRVKFSEDENEAWSKPGTKKLCDKKKKLTYDIGIKSIIIEHLFWHEDENQDIFYTILEPLIFPIIKGTNGNSIIIIVCVLCYGQTGSGKTYTMYGNHANVIYI